MFWNCKQLLNNLNCYFCKLFNVFEMLIPVNYKFWNRLNTEIQLWNFRIFQNKYIHRCYLLHNIKVSYVDLLGCPTITAVSDHCFHTCCPSICPYVRVRMSVPTFINLAKQSENNVHYWRDCGSDRVDHWWHLSCT